jgi:hypothetical protein
VKRAAVSPGIALSAPAILSKHEYIETLLIKQPEQQTPSTRRNDKTSKKIFSPKKRKLKSDKIYSLNSSEHIEIDSKNLQNNLPEFIHFQSDHLVLTPQLNSHSSSDRLRSLSASQISKTNRTSQTTTITTINPMTYPSIKRISRSRHSYDCVVYHEKQQQQKYSLRSIPNKFDSISCFNEVSRLEIFSVFFFFFFFFFIFILFIRPHDIFIA